MTPHLFKPIFGDAAKAAYFGWLVDWPQPEAVALESIIAKYRRRAFKRPHQGQVK